MISSLLPETYSCRVELSRMWIWVPGKYERFVYDSRGGVGNVDV
jgi:hypothetical protein